MAAAYEAMTSGGQVFSHVLVGHFAMFAASPGIPGQPNVLRQRADRDVAADYARMKPGDFLLTNGASLINPDKGTIPQVGPDAARARGAYTVGITCCYVRFYKTPLGAFLPVKMTTTLEGVCDVLLDSGCTWSCDVISTPALPEFKICSTSGLSQFLVYWACTAARCARIGSDGAERHGPDARPGRQLRRRHQRRRLGRHGRPPAQRAPQAAVAVVLAQRLAPGPADGGLARPGRGPPRVDGRGLPRRLRRLGRDAGPGPGRDRDRRRGLLQLPGQRPRHARGDVDDALWLYFLDNFRANDRNLLAVKRRWDPDDVCHHAQSIPVE